MKRVALFVGCGLMVSSTTASAQTLEDLRDQIRSLLTDSHFAAGLAALVLLNEELELAGASYEIDGETRISSFVLPFSQVYRPFAREDVALYAEGVLGYTSATESTADIWSGTLPGLETTADSEWITYGFFAGGGPQYGITEELSITGILSVGVARIENHTDYSGPGAPLTAALFDGLAFNWSAWAMNYGAAARLDWEHVLGERRKLSLVARYDSRWTDTFETDDPSQQFAEQLQLATFRAEFGAPTGWTLGRFPVDYTLRTGFRRVVEGSIFGVEEFYEVGGGLEFLTGDMLPKVNGIKVSGSAFFGDNVRGWTIGLGLQF